MSQTIIVLFNLKPTVSKLDYEAWAKETDLVTVRTLKSVDEFKVYKSTALLGSDTPPPYDYIEILRVNDMEVFGQNIGTPVMEAVAAEFQKLADNPTFILTHDIETKV